MFKLEKTIIMLILKRGLQT